MGFMEEKCNGRNIFRHPIVRRGDRVISMLSPSCDVHAAQHRLNSCALSELAGGMWRVKPFETLRFCRGEGNKLYEVSEYLDQVSGAASQAALENLHAKVKFEKILEEKIRTVHNSVTGARSGKPSGFVKDEQNISMSASDSTPNPISLQASLTSGFSENCTYIGEFPTDFG
ncbi:hypothetical protein ANCCAN_10774 [Ancylostoma caninum]|uniref:Uncharacterized protein n=1 Tax=Ancylostoma caninum TaxID=29170 RepID=A0A368GIX3_ANCCA|nr:hypothetical protein ANCCAN_10774 [Ancylostoma caninum]